MKKSIVINGREYPSRLTMGAMLRFREETGHDVSRMASDDIKDLIVFIWSCCVSACNADKVEFGYSLMDFADNIEPGVIKEFYKETEEQSEQAAQQADPPTS